MRGILLFLLYESIIFPHVASVSATPDPRPEQLTQFLSQHKSPLAPSASTFIITADTYHLDWTLLPAIAGVESGFERAGNVSDFDPFGWMCGSNPCVFRSYDEGIETVARTLATGGAYARFRESGSIAVLAETYCQVNPVDWTRKVEYFQSALKGGE